MRKILYGICGIGNGHAYRQWPILEWLLDVGHEVAIFAYGDSYTMLRQRLEKRGNALLLQVAVPFYPGNDHGLDFATAAARLNVADLTNSNMTAMAAVQAHIGRPDLVISDYEPNSALYAYASDAPLITVDQQSKFLRRSLPQPLNGHFYNDEISRLSMFFPKANQRIACSFFQVPESGIEKVMVVPPILRQEVVDLKRQPRSARTSLLFYISAVDAAASHVMDLPDICRALEDIDCHVFIPKTVPLPENFDLTNVYYHGDPEFLNLLAQSHGVVATAGHSLISECMYLGIPMLVLPLPVYEQQLSAHIIMDNEFGMTAPGLTTSVIREFISRLPDFASSIVQDKNNVLLRQDGLPQIKSAIQSLLLRTDN